MLAVYNMVNRRRRLHTDALAARPDWPVMPMASAVEAAADTRAPVGAAAPRSASAEAFVGLSRVIERRLAS